MDMHAKSLDRLPPCGDEVFPFDDSDARYFCQDGQTAGVANCSQGCEDGKCLDPGVGSSNPL